MGSGDAFTIPVALAIALLGAVIVLVERHRRTAAAAAASEALLTHERTATQAMLDQLPVGILTIDLDTRTIVRANTQARSLLEQPLKSGSPSGVVMEGFAFDADDRPAAPLDELLDRARTTGTSVVEERHVIRPDGSSRLLVVAAEALAGGETEPALGLVIVSDLSRAQESTEPSGHAPRLESGGEAVAALAHDLGNQLTALVCFLELLTTGPRLDPDAREHAGEALACAHLAAAQTRRLVETAARLNPRRRQASASESI